MITKQILENELIKFLCDNDVHVESVIIEIPKDIKNGSFSTNVALKEAKKAGFNNPAELADKIKNEFQFNGIVKIEVAGPGFINFFTDNNNNLNVIKEILNADKNYGQTETFKDEFINIEYISANPTGELHLGHARNGVVGSTLGNLYKKAGAKVAFEYYINDAGNQIENLGKSLYARYLEQNEIPFELPEDGYHGKDIVEIAKQITEQIGNAKVEEYEADYWKEMGIKFQLKRIESILNEFNCNIEIWTSEKSLSESDDYEEKIQNIYDHTYTKDGAKWIETTKVPQFGDDKDRVLVKADGSFTYLVGDILNHMKKWESENKYTKLINIWGADHHGYFPRVRAAMSLLGYPAEDLEVVIIQMVQLLENGETMKMSKRSGNAVTIRELIEEVGVDATRFMFVSREPSSHLDFDVEIAKKNDSDNPVYYIQYANARINSVLTKAKEQGIEVDSNTTSYSYNEEEQKLIMLLNEMPNAIISAAKKHQPNILAAYVTNVATMYHKYYANNKIIESSDLEATCGKIMLSKATQIVIKNSLDILGCSCPDKM